MTGAAANSDLATRRQRQGAAALAVVGGVGLVLLGHVVRQPEANEWLDDIALPSAGVTQGRVIQATRPAMGTLLRVSIWVASDHRGAADAAAQAALDRVSALEARTSSWQPTSATAAINRGAYAAPVHVEPELRELIAISQDWARRSDGAFDITGGPLFSLWAKAREEGVLPTAAEIDEQRASVGHQDLHLVGDTVRFGRPGMRLGFGAVGKGFAADQAAAFLRDEGWSDFTIDLGGDVVVSGTRGGSPWRVAIQHPREQTMLAEYRSTGGAIATSGDYEQYVVIDGRRYSHIIDPRTGRPVAGPASVTVLARRCADADAMATAVSVMAPDRRLRFIESLPGVEAVIVAEGGDVQLSTGLKMVGGRLERVSPARSVATDSPAPQRTAAGAIERFQTDVVPVLDRRCGGCHGATTAELEHLDDDTVGSLLLWEVNGAGRIHTRDQVRGAYERLTRRSSDHPTRPLIDARYPPAASSLLNAGLSQAHAGAGSAHHEVFASPADPDFRTLQAWVSDRISAAPAPPDELKGEAERFFAKEVVPVLMRKSCFGSNCHGAHAFNDLKLVPGVPLLPELFTPTMHKENRRRMLGASTRLVHLSGDVEQSKQLLKTIPIAEGGILHKGGNHFFEKGDPDYRTLVRWLELEAAEARATTGQPLGEQRGIVFVRRPRDTPERLFEDAAFMPGAALLWRRDGEEIDLAAHLHPDGPADLRAPDVSYDGRRVVFAMRRHEGDPFNLWEVQLDSRAARQLTFSSDPQVHYLDPLYVPDPGEGLGQADEADQGGSEALVLVSNRAGAWSAASPEALLGEAEGGDHTTLLDDDRNERAGTFDGRRVEIVRGTNAGQVRTVLRQGAGEIVVDRPFELPCDSTTHYVIDATVRMAPKYDTYRMRPGPAGGERQAFERTLVRMTYAESHVRRPTLRSSGGPIVTTLRSGWQSGRPYFNGALFRLHVDGSDFHPHYGERSQIPLLSDDRELPNGLAIRIGRSADSYWGGSLILSDHQLGPAIEPDNPLDDLDHPFRAGPPVNSLPRFFPGWIHLDPAARPRGVSEGGAYRDPYPLPDGSLLVAHAAGPIDLHDPAAAPDFDIVRLVPDPAFQRVEGLEPGPHRRELVVAGPDAELWPRPVVVRLQGRITPGVRLHHDELLFGAPVAVGGFSGYPTGTPALLQIFDLATIEAFFEQFTPVGAKHLRVPSPGQPGQSADTELTTHVRLVAQHPLPEGVPGPPERVILAEGPLEEDGSYQAMIPSGLPFQVQALNPDGMAVSALRRWLYALPGERHTLSVPRVLFPQTCGGCHGGLTGKGEDVLRRPDVVSSASRSIAVWDPSTRARRRPPPPSESPSDGSITATWEHDVAPLIARRCAGCHRADAPAAGLALDGPAAYESLRHHIEHREGLAIESYLVEKLLGRELRAPRDLAGDVPHPSSQPLSTDELKTVVRWIDLGSPGRALR